MKYPYKELMRDYQRWSNPVIPMPDLPDGQRMGLMKSFFQQQYRDSPDLAEDRFLQMRKGLALIGNSQETIQKMGLGVVRPAKYGSLAKSSLILAAHDLVNIREIEQPTPEMLRDAVEKFEKSEEDQEGK